MKCDSDFDLEIRHFPKRETETLDMYNADRELGMLLDMMTSMLLHL